MGNLQAKPSIWRRIAAALENMDGAFDPSTHDREKITALEKRIERLEARFLKHGISD